MTMAATGLEIQSSSDHSCLRMPTWYCSALLLREGLTPFALLLSQSTLREQLRQWLRDGKTHTRCLAPTRQSLSPALVPRRLQTMPRFNILDVRCCAVVRQDPAFRIRTCSVVCLQQKVHVQLMENAGSTKVAQYLRRHAL